MCGRNREKASEQIIPTHQVDCVVGESVEKDPPWKTCANDLDHYFFEDPFDS